MAMHSVEQGSCTTLISTSGSVSPCWRYTTVGPPFGISRLSSLFRTRLEPPKTTRERPVYMLN